MAGEIMYLSLLLNVALILKVIEYRPNKRK